MKYSARVKGAVLLKRVEKVVFVSGGHTEDKYRLNIHTNKH